MIRKGKFIACKLCKIDVYVPIWRQKRFRFCSKKCHGDWTGLQPNKGRFIKGQNLGKNHPNYKGGFIAKSGYKLIMHNGRQSLEHRVIIEVYLGRKLQRHEVIHHINHIKTDNRIENLKVMSRGEHTKIHPEVSFQKGHPNFFHKL